MAQEAAAFLARAGYAQRKRVPSGVADVEFVYLHPRDVVTYVGSGACDFGLASLDLLRESDVYAESILDLGFGHTTLRFGAPLGRFAALEDLANMRVATAYPRLAAKALRDAGVAATVIALESVEGVARYGLADAVLATSDELARNCLETFGPLVLDTVAWLLASPAERAGSAAVAVVFRKRLEGALTARRFVLVDYTCPRVLLPATLALTPHRARSAVVTSLQAEGWVAVRVLVPTTKAPETMDGLHALGARAVLATALRAARMP